jgi:hypothetical protein
LVDKVLAASIIRFGFGWRISDAASAAEAAVLIEAEHNILNFDSGSFPEWISISRDRCSAIAWY